jgi:hypothetical protein
LLIGLLAMKPKLQEADCQSAAGFHPAPLGIRVSMRQLESWASTGYKS